MSHPNFINHILMALGLAVFSSVAVLVLPPLLGYTYSIALMIPALTLSYLIFLFTQAEEKSGRVICLSLWLAMTLCIWVFSPSIWLSIAMHLGAVWLVRSLYFYNSIIGPVADLVLIGCSVAVALWSYFHTGSWFFSVWSLFLTQAFFVAIPPSLKRRTQATQRSAANTQKFNNAQASAEAALRQLFTQ